MPMDFVFVAQTQPGGLQAFLGSLALPLMVFAIFYVIWFLPLRKKQKEVEIQIAALERGDKVVTNGGLFGEVVKADGPVLVLKIADNVRVRVRRSAIAGLEGSGDTQGTQT